MRVALFGSLVASGMGQDTAGQVVELLQSMLEETKANLKKDTEHFTKLNCWCKETKAETQTGMDNATDCVKEQGGIEESQTGRAAEQGTKADEKEAEIKEGQEKLTSDTAQREKEAAEFQKNQVDLTKSIGALKSAVTVLKKHQGGFLQTSVTNEVASVVEQHQDRLSPSQRTIINAFMQQPTAAKYSSQSGEIFGILESMLEEMSADLKEATEEEMAAETAFGKMKKALTQELAEKDKLMKGHREKAAQAAEDAANAKDEKARCEKELETLTNVMRSANEQCTTGKSDFEKQSAATEDEIQAITKALEILNSEDAHAKFGKTTDATMFLQTSLRKLARSKQSENVMKALKYDVNTDDFENLGLGRATQQVALLLQEKGIEGQSDQFATILQAVDEQIQAKKALLSTKLAEKDTCVENINISDDAITAHNGEITRLKAQIEQLEGAIKNLEEKIAADLKQKEETETSTKKVSEDRSEANAQYQKEMEENRQAIELLDKAKGVMAAVYGGPVFVQQDPNVAQGAPQLEKRDQHEGGGNVIVMLDRLIATTKGEMKVSQTAENAAQKAYETAVKNNNDMIKALKASIAKAGQIKSDKKDEKLSDEKDLDTEETGLTNEEEKNAGFHKSCDFLVDNFEAITTAHGEEVSALEKAQVVLQGVIDSLASL